jgi:AraC-like DNA-binding protein
MSGRLLRIQNWEKLAREAQFQPSTMAALCPISLRQLQRFFETEFEKTPREWVRELRCRLALRLVAKGWLNKAVAAELHFADESHFCHEFKKVFGFSPQTYSPIYGGAGRASHVGFDPHPVTGPTNGATRTIANARVKDQQLQQFENRLTTQTKPINS